MYYPRIFRLKKHYQAHYVGDLLVDGQGGMLCQRLELFVL